MAPAVEAQAPYKDDVTFETGLESLEGLIRRMEGAQLTLEESMTAYTEGLRLARMLESQLQVTEQRLTLLSLEPVGGSTASAEAMEE